MLDLGYGLTNAAPHDRGERRPPPAATSQARRERPEHGLQNRVRGATRLSVLPSTSPANAALSYDEGLRWSRALRAELGG